MRAQLIELAGDDAVRPGAPGAPVHVAPSSTEQAAAVLAAASREGWRVRLAGTGRRRPVRAHAADVVLSAERLAGLTIYEPDDLTLGCRAGCRHGALAETTAAHRQLLPLEPAAGPDATIGGTLALADAGPLRAGYGAPRDLVLGVTAVTGDGRVVTLGGRVVKNVAGYDLVRLLVGSRGTLAFITELHVRLRSVPECDATLLLETRDAAEAAALGLAIRDAAGPAALEVIGPARPGGGWQLAVRLHGSTEAVKDAIAGVSVLSAAAPVTLPPPAAADWWQTLAAREQAAPLRLRLGGLPDRLGALLEAAEHCRNAWSDNVLGEQAEAAAGAVLAHATEGIVRLGLPLPASARGAAGSRAGPAAGVLAELGVEVVSVDGTWSYDAGREALAEALAAADGSLPEPPVRPAALVRLERGLKAQFDPAGTLPGWDA